MTIYYIKLSFHLIYFKSGHLYKVVFMTDSMIIGDQEMQLKQLLQLLSQASLTAEAPLVDVVVISTLLSCKILFLFVGDS